MYAVPKRTLAKFERICINMCRIIQLKFYKNVKLKFLIWSILKVEMIKKIWR